MANCPYCSTSIDSFVGFSATCPSCGKILHCCECCDFYSPESHYGCRESIDDPVWDKQKSNFCDHFRLTSKNLSSNAQSAADKAQKARAALDSLFNF